MGPLFITGATGLVGRACLTALHGRASRITCLTRKPEALSDLLSGRQDWRAVEGDLQSLARDPSPLSGSSTVLHLAASTGKASASVHREVNVEGTRGLLVAARAAGVRRFVFVSSIAAKFPDRRFYPYAEAKLVAESLVSESGLDWAIVRPTMVFGPGSAVQAGLEKLACAPVGVCFGNGNNRVQPIQVDDLARVLVELMTQPTLDMARVEVGGPDAIPMLELLRRIRQARRGQSEPFLRVPLEPLRSLLGLVEPVLLPIMPLSAGQLASFANDGVASPSPLVDGLRSTMQSLDAMLAGAGA
jgi:NADH dehydrogenase